MKTSRWISKIRKCTVFTRLASNVLKCKSQEERISSDATWRTLGISNRPSLRSTYYSYYCSHNIFLLTLGSFMPELDIRSLSRFLLLFILPFILAEIDGRVFFDHQKRIVRRNCQILPVKEFRSMFRMMKSRLSEEKERCKFHIQRRKRSLLRILVDHEFTAHFRNCSDFDRLWTDICRFIQITRACIFFKIRIFIDTSGKIVSYSAVTTSTVACNARRIFTRYARRMLFSRLNTLHSEFYFNFATSSF